MKWLITLKYAPFSKAYRVQALSTRPERTILLFLDLLRELLFLLWFCVSFGRLFGHDYFDNFGKDFWLCFAHWLKWLGIWVPADFPQKLDLNLTVLQTLVTPKIHSQQLLLNLRQWPVVQLHLSNELLLTHCLLKVFIVIFLFLIMIWPHIFRHKKSILSFVSLSNRCHLTHQHRALLNCFIDLCDFLIISRVCLGRALRNLPFFLLLFLDLLNFGWWFFEHWRSCLCKFGCDWILQGLNWGKREFHGFIKELFVFCLIEINGFESTVLFAHALFAFKSKRFCSFALNFLRKVFINFFLVLIHVKIEEGLFVKHLIADEAFGGDGFFESGGRWSVERFFRIGGGRASEHTLVFFEMSWLFFEINEWN